MTLPLKVLFLLCCVLPFSLPAARADSMVFEGRKILGALSAGIPGGLTLEGDYRIHERFTVGAALGGLIFNFPNATGFTLTLGTVNANLLGRWHPFAGSFYLGLAAGGRSIFARGTQVITVSGNAIATDVELRVNNLILSPHLGWLWVIGRGFSFGFDLGAQVPFNTNAVVNTSSTNPLLNSLLNQLEATTEYQNLVSQVNTFATPIGRFVLPYVAIRVGWAFDIIDGHFSVTDAPQH